MAESGSAGSAGSGSGSGSGLGAALRSSIPRSLVLLLPLTFLLVFYLWPLSGILRQGLFADDGLGLDLGHTVSRSFRPAILRVILFTFGQALASTLLTLALGLPLAWAFARLRFPGRSVMRALATLPFVMPTIVVAAGFTALLGPGGALDAVMSRLLGPDAPRIELLNSLWIILMAHAFYNLGVVIRTVGGFWENLGPQLEEAAAVLGAGPWQRFRHVTLPLLMPAILSAGLLVFLFCFTSFGVILVLGGPSFATLEVEIYRQATGLVNLPVAATLSLFQMGLALLLLRGYARLQTGLSLPLELRPQAALAARPSTGMGRMLLAMAMALLLSLLLAPLLALVWRSLTLGGGFGLQHYRSLADPEFAGALVRSPWVATRNSLLIASVTTVLSLVLGLTAALSLARDSEGAAGRSKRDVPEKRRIPNDLAEPAGADPLLPAPTSGRQRSWIDPLVMLPLGTSAVTLGLGYILVFGRWLQSPLLIPAAHALIATPFVLRILLPALRRRDPRLREAAATLGASPMKVGLRIDLPLIAPALTVAMVFAFMVSLGEFGASLLISRPQQPTLPIMIYRVLRPGLGSYGISLALSVILMLVTALGMLLIEGLRPSDAEAF